MGQRQRPRAVPFWKLFKLRKWLPGVLAAAAGLTGPVDMALAQPASPPVTMPTPGMPGAVVPHAPATPTPAAPPEKTVTIDFDKADWNTEVLEWYAKETGLTLITTVKPTGTVSLKGKGRKYTIGEATDLINEALIQQKFILIRRHMTFFIQPSDEKIDPTLLPRVTPAELAKRGRTEIVQVVLPVEGVLVTDAVEEMKKLLTPFGTMLPLERPNALLIQDTVGNITRIQQLIDDTVDKTKAPDSLNHVCKYRRPQEIAESLKTLMGTDVKVDVSGAQQAPQYNDQRGGGYGRDQYGRDQYGRDQYGRDQGYGGYPQNQGRGTPATGGGRVKTVQVAVDARRNAILVTAPPDKIGLARKIIEDADKPITPDQKPLEIADPVMKSYGVQAGSAPELAKNVTAKFPWVQAVALPQQNQLLVFGAPADHEDVKKYIGIVDAGTGAADMVFIPLNSLDPGEAAATLTKLLPTTLQGGASIEPQKTGTNTGLLVKGTPAQIEEIKKALGLIGEPGLGNPGVGTTPGAASNSRVLNLGGTANPAIVAEMLGKAMEGMGKRVIINDPLNPKQPIIPRTNGGLPPAADPRTVPQPPKLPDPVRPGPLGTRNALPGRDFVLAAQVVDPAKDDAPLVITVAGGRLIVQCDDPKALEVFSQLARYITTDGTKVDENLFKVIRLKYVAAEDAARELTEIFNGPQQQQQGGRGGALGGLNPLALLGLGGGGGAASPDTKNRIRVVAEKSSNSVIVVKASPIDAALIEKMLASVIDGGTNDSAAVLKTFILPVKNADASEMAQVIRDVYRSAMATSGGGAAGALPLNPLAALAGGGGGGGQPQRPPALSISVNDRTNSLIILAAETLYTDIKELVDQLDTAKVATTEQVQLVKLRGVDPNVVQQAINAMQGRDTRQQQGRGGIGGGGLGGGGLGGGGGGLGGGGLGGLGGGGLGGLGGGGFGGLGGGGLGGGGLGGMGGGRGAGGGIGGGGATGGGGGGARGGGGGGGARGGGGAGGRQANLGGSQEGPVNFDYRGKDAPSAVSYKLYDPMTDAPDFGYNRPAAPKPLSHIVLAGGAQPPREQPLVPGGPLPMDPPPAPPGYGAPGGIDPNTYSGAAPRGTITAIPITGLDSVVLRTGDAKDLEIVLQLIEVLQKQTKDTQPRVEVIYLDHGDANVIANQFNALLGRIQFGQNGTYNPAGRVGGQQQQAGGLGGGVATGATQNIAAVALPRFNAIMLVAPEGRFEDVRKELKRLLDQPNSAPFKEFVLKNASAQIVATQLQNFWTTRYLGEPLAANQFRVTFDIPSNRIFIQGSPGDLRDAEELITKMDTAVSGAVNDLRIFKLKNALSDELGQVLSQALTANVLNPLPQSSFTTPVPPTTTAGGQAFFGGGAAVQGLGGQIGGGQQPGGAVAQPGGQAAPGGAAGGLQVAQINALIPTIGTGSAGGIHTKTTSIRFHSVSDGKTYETGFLSDVHIVSNARINTLIIAAPKETMSVIERLIDNLDTVAAARSYVNVFQLSRGADANLTSNLLAQLFTGQGRQANQGIAQNQGLGATGQARPVLTLTGNPSDGASLVDLRLSVDDRTNSLVVAGSLNDLETIRAVISKLEGSNIQGRYNEVVKLRNAAAADVANAVQQFFTASLAIYTASFTSAYQQLQRNVVVIAEPVSNTVLISATPEYYGEIKRIIERIDSQPPQVVIQVTIAEVQLNNTEEAGVEVGLQSPVFFQRGATTTPGFNFNMNNILPNSANVGPGTVGFQGLGNLGLGRTSPTQGVGGFVFSASSDTFNLLVRALKAQGRVDVLSRPQVQVSDNQTGYINVGQNFPFATASTITNGLAQQGIEYRDIGIQLRVTPRVNPDGKVLMRVEPSVSSVQPGTVSVGGIQASVVNAQTVQTTVLASDGETIVLGGLISRQETRNETGIPYAKDIPYLGALFRYRTHTIARREILIIMTPHIVRSEFDNARVLAEEAGKMKWCTPEVLRAHGHGGEVIGPAMQGARPVPVGTPQPQPNFAPNPGPAHFGTFNAPVPLDGAPAFAPGAMQPGVVQPGTVPPAMPPGAAPGGALVLPAQPLAPMPGQPVSGGPQPNLGVLPPAAPVALPAVPVGAAPQQQWPAAPAGGLMQASATQPVFAPQVPVARPMAVPTGYVMQPPGGAPVAPAVAPVPGRNFGMAAPVPPAHPQTQPAAGKDAPPADQKPATKTTEGSWTFGR